MQVEFILQFSITLFFYQEVQSSKPNFCEFEEEIFVYVPKIKIVQQKKDRKDKTGILGVLDPRTYLNRNNFENITKTELVAEKQRRTFVGCCLGFVKKGDDCMSRNSTPVSFSSVTTSSTPIKPITSIPSSLTTITSQLPVEPQLRTMVPEPTNPSITTFFSSMRSDVNYSLTSQSPSETTSQSMSSSSSFSSTILSESFTSVGASTSIPSSDANSLSSASFQNSGNQSPISGHGVSQDKQVNLITESDRQSSSTEKEITEVTYPESPTINQSSTTNENFQETSTEKQAYSTAATAIGDRTSEITEQPSSSKSPVVDSRKSSESTLTTTEISRHSFTTSTNSGSTLVEMLVDHRVTTSQELQPSSSSSFEFPVVNNIPQSSTKLNHSDTLISDDIPRVSTTEENIMQLPTTTPTSSVAIMPSMVVIETVPSVWEEKLELSHVGLVQSVDEIANILTTPCESPTTIISLETVISVDDKMSSILINRDIDPKIYISPYIFINTDSYR